MSDAGGAVVRKRFFAWLYSRIERSESADLTGCRRRLLGDLEGDVLEVGAGNGPNFRHYPASARATATDYSEHMLWRARETAAGASATIEVRQADAMALPFEDASFDAVVVTLVLCSVPDQVQTLTELHRVLRPGGELRVLEHVRSERRWVAAVQTVATPPWSLFGDGCQLHRDTATAVRQSAFEVLTEDRPDIEGNPLPHLVLTARRAAS
jgi:SAM-dependent methyltransferase